MKTVGIIGGIAPESTIEYYRKIVESYLERHGTGHYPQIVINSIDMKKMLDLIGDGKLEEVTDYLGAEVKKLEKAGADFGVLASNTPHVVFDNVRQRSQLPLISIVEVTCNKIAEIGLQKVALFGTKFTMQGGFYSGVLSKSSIEVVIPEEADQDFIHAKYMHELVKGIILDETRSNLLNIVNKMQADHNIQGLILGGTELPLILKADDVNDIHVFDTTEIHVASILNALL
ncbi:MAG: amino acid racemase [Cyanobacteria bacterium P01_D01_bin.156]